ncbi:Uma2 family endonuclease [Candidatus Desantisbacteria bacterium CG_4_10_14_3_um_filter_40_18]|uniref:Uma2 family endonuclease n=1 Tax=Candidatus Desantisbacteria bacterium CG_4_10_14_3_um_filter_40_18 TaxID=1974544 RepID=A0A2M7P049_9BACT|nr:MAG: Uma2 family endonuclease [Candidatus Desantisbacteria bacterium CG_4_10_14_3_um_filter_40_18]
MGFAVRKKEERFIYGDYLTWSDNERWELIDGVAYDMSPAPSRRHQKIVGELYRQFSNYLLDKSCEVYVAPFDVRLPEFDEADEDIDTVVQPDIVVVCDRDKLDDKGGKGAPDIVIEILSLWTAKKDLLIKYHLYERHKVKQYWVFDPATEEVTIFKLQNDKYGKPEEYKKDDRIKVDIFTDLEIDLSTVFKLF